MQHRLAARGARTAQPFDQDGSRALDANVIAAPSKACAHAELMLPRVPVPELDVRILRQAADGADYGGSENVERAQKISLSIPGISFM